MSVPIIFGLRSFQLHFPKKKEKGCPAQSPSITMFFPIALQHAIQPTLNQSLGPFQANLFSEKYSPIVLQWLGPPQPSNSFKESWQNLSHKVFVWSFFMKLVFVQAFIGWCFKKTTYFFQKHDSNMIKSSIYLLKYQVFLQKYSFFFEWFSGNYV